MQSRILQRSLTQKEKSLAGSWKPGKFRATYSLLWALSAKGSWAYLQHLPKTSWRVAASQLIPDIVYVEAQTVVAAVNGETLTACRSMVVLFISFYSLAPCLFSFRPLAANVKVNLIIKTGRIPTVRWYTPPLCGLCPAAVPAFKHKHNGESTKKWSALCINIDNTHIPYQTLNLHNTGLFLPSPFNLNKYYPYNCKCVLSVRVITHLIYLKDTYYPGARFI